MTTIEGRREARRKNILENSENRLQRITGVEKRNASHELEGYRSSENVGEIYSENVINLNQPIDEDSNIELPSRLGYIHSSSFTPLVGANLTSGQGTVIYSKAYRNLIIVLIAFLVNFLLYFFENQDSRFLNKIFIPLLCFEAVDIIYNYSEPNEDLAKYLILFKISGHILILIIKYVGIITTVLRDVMVYLFAFVCILYFRSMFTTISYVAFF